MSNLGRRGRPPKVQELGEVVSVSVRGQDYRFKRDVKGVLRPANPNDGVSEDRQYAKTVIQRHLTEAE